MGLLYDVQGRLAEGLPYFQRAVEISPQEPWLSVALGNAYRKRNNTEGARAAYLQAKALDASYVESYIALGRLYTTLGQDSDALASYQQAVRADPGSAHARVVLGNAFADQGSPADAVAEYKRALAADPSYSPAHLALATQYKGLGQLDAALNMLRRAIDVQPNDLVGYLRLAGLYRQEKDWDAALDVYRQALKIAGGNGIVHGLHGDTQRAKGNPEAALADLIASQGRDPSSVAPPIFAGLIYEKLAGEADGPEAKRQQDAAIASFLHAVDVSPGSGWAREVLADAYRKRGMRNEATREYETSAQVDPARASAYQGLVEMIEEDLGSLDTEIARYENIRQGDPGAIWIHGVLGAAYRPQGRTNDAIGAYQKMAKLAPTNPEAHAQLAQLYLEKGKGQEALREYQIYLSLAITGSVSEEAAYRYEWLSGYAITSPIPNERLSGNVEIRGTATVPDFQFYKVEYGLGKNPDQWFSIGTVRTDPVIDGVLANWIVNGLPSGEYVLRLTVVDKTGNYPPPYEVPVTIGR
jgi:tetratricopeptide (TPR) repeat protein